MAIGRDGNGDLIRTATSLLGDSRLLSKSEVFLRFPGGEPIFIFANIVLKREDMIREK